MRQGALPLGPVGGNDSPQTPSRQAKVLGTEQTLGPKHFCLRGWEGSEENVFILA